MAFNRLIAAGIALVASAVGLIITADHTKEEIKELQEQQKMEDKKRQSRQALRFQSGLDAWKTTEGAVLIDVREREDYDKDHIPGSIFLDLRTIPSEIESAVPDHSTPIFVYCYRGSRSSQAEALIREAGYENVTNIGGIEWWRA